MYYIQNLSMVVMAKEPQSFNPNTINPEFLSDAGIVPGSWECRRFIKELVEVDIQYANGVGWKLNPQRLDMIETLSPPYSFQDRYAVQDLALRFLEKFEGPYGDFGVNYFLFMVQRDPAIFLKEKFAPTLLSHKESITTPTFLSGMRGGKRTIKLNSGELKIEEKDPREVVAIDCNLNFDGPMTAASIAEQVTDLKELEQELLLLLNLIFGLEAGK